MSPCDRDHRFINIQQKCASQQKCTDTCRHLTTLKSHCAYYCLDIIFIQVADIRDSLPCYLLIMPYKFFFPCLPSQGYLVLMAPQSKQLAVFLLCGILAMAHFMIGAIGARSLSAACSEISTLKNNSGCYNGKGPDLILSISRRSNKYLFLLRYNTSNEGVDLIMQMRGNHINNIHEIMMISTNVHLFIHCRWKIKLTFESAQYATA